MLPAAIEIGGLFDEERLGQLSAGAAHSLALTSFGYLFAFGNCRAGQCGLATGEPAPKATAGAAGGADAGAAGGDSNGGSSSAARAEMPARGPPRPVRLPSQGNVQATAAHGPEEGARDAAARSPPHSHSQWQRAPGRPVGKRAGGERRADAPGMPPESRARGDRRAAPGRTGLRHVSSAGASAGGEPSPGPGPRRASGSAEAEAEPEPEADAVAEADSGAEASVESGAADDSSQPGEE